LNIEQNAESLTDDQKAMLYRVVQESLTNVAKHSYAKNVNIDTTMSERTLTMKIEDNGKGIPSEILMSDGRNGKGLGILGMRERVRIAKGEFDVDSKKGKGTTIRVQIPLNGK
jgi:signal transduction histidine kinase